MSDSSAKSPLSNVVVLSAIIVFLSALVTRLVFIGAPLGSDDAIYFALAENPSLSMFDTAIAQWPFRLGMIVPLSVAQELFGYNLLAYYVFSVGFSVATVMMVFFVARKIGGLRAGVMSALVFATSALALYHGTQVLPDTPNLCALLVAFFLFISCDGHKGRRNLILLGLAAAAAFYAHTVRMPNGVFLAALPIYEFLARRSIRRTLTFSAFFAGFIAIECLFFLIVTGNPIKRIMLVPKGVTLWIKHQETLSVTDYLFDPITDILRFKTGWILFVGGIAGLVTAIRRRCFELIALGCGALLIFLAYSYPVTSFDPLVRALPLQPRYIVAFTCALAMFTGYALANLDSIAKRKVPRWAVASVLGLAITVQVTELDDVPNTALFTDDGLWVGSRVVRDAGVLHNIKSPVRAYPANVFRMYSGFRSLDLVGYGLHEAPQPGAYYLVLKSRVIRTVRAARAQKDHSTAAAGDALLTPHKNREVLAETSAFVLMFMRDPNAKPVVDVAKVPELWNSDKGSRLVGDGTQSYQLEVHKSHSYITMLANPATKPPESHHWAFDKLEPDATYDISFEYRLAKPLSSLRVFIRQFNDTKTTELVTKYIGRTAGTHQFRTKLRTKSDYKSFRIFLRVANQEPGNIIHLDKLTFTKLR